jgi:hypothetical protein
MLKIIIIMAIFQHVNFIFSFHYFGGLFNDEINLRVSKVEIPNLFSWGLYFILLHLTLLSNGLCILVLLGISNLEVLGKLDTKWDKPQIA